MAAQALKVIGATSHGGRFMESGGDARSLWSGPLTRGELGRYRNKSATAPIPNAVIQALDEAAADVLLASEASA